MLVQHKWSEFFGTKNKFLVQQKTCLKKIGGQKNTVLVQKKFEEKSQNDRGLIASKLYGCLHHGIRHEFQC